MCISIYVKLFSHICISIYLFLDICVSIFLIHTWSCFIYVCLPLHTHMHLYAAYIYMSGNIKGMNMYTDRNVDEQCAF